MDPIELAQYKLDEAKYFLNQFEENITDEKIAKYNLSAFLAAANSVVQIPFCKKEYRILFDKHYKDNPFLTFIKNLRDRTIHHGLLPTALMQEYVAIYRETMPGVYMAVEKIKSPTEEDIADFKEYTRKFPDQDFHILTWMIWSFTDFPENIELTNNVDQLALVLVAELERWLRYLKEYALSI